MTILSETAIGEPDRLAIDMPGGGITYSELERDVDLLAGWIAGRVGGAAAAVAVRTVDARTATTAFLAIERCGCIAVPIDPAGPLERALFVADDVEAKVILTDDVAFFAGDSRVADVVGCVAAGRLFGPPSEVAPDAIAVIAFTSGSTGTPKGIVSYHKSSGGLPIPMPESQATTWRIGLPFMGTISNSASVISHCVAGRATLVPYDIRSRGVHGLGAFLREEQISSFATVPTLLRAILDTSDPGDVWPTLRRVVTWGEGLTWRDVERLRGHVASDACICSTYGSTEAGIIATYVVTPETPIGEGIVPAGVPSPGITVRIVDADGNDVPDGADGEIVAIGTDVGVEYWHRPDLSARVFRPLPNGERACWTGDRGRMLPDGMLQQLGRLDHMVKISGNRVDLGEIEVALRAMDDVAEAGVIARPDAVGDNRLIAFVAARDTAIVPGEVRSRLVRQLPGYMVPDAVCVLDSLPTLPNGKIDRRTLAESGERLPASDSEPSTEGETLEGRLRAIWSEVLEQPIGLNDRFVDLGADSIRAARAFAMIESRLGYDRPISLMLEAPTVAELATRLSGSHESWHPLVPFRTNGSRAPLFVVHGGGGDVMFAAGLAKYVDADVPVYGLQPSTLSGRLTEDVSIDSLARRYVEVIRAVQPNGPYFLAGYSLGGLVATEMTCLLEADGERVMLLAIGDTPAPGEEREPANPGPEPPPITPKNLVRRAARSIAYRMRRRKRRMIRRIHLRRIRYAINHDRTVSPMLRQEFSMWQLGEAARGYSPTGVARAPVLLIRTGSLGGVTPEAWAPFAQGPIDTVLIPGKHTLLVHEPMIEQFGRALSERCTAAATVSA